MKYLTDSEILAWNERLSNSEYKLSARYNNRNGYPDILISKIIKMNQNFGDLTKVVQGIESPLIDYIFSFSVSSNRVDYFFSILKRLIKKTFNTKLLVLKGEEKKELILDIKYNQGFQYTTNKHRILNKDFTKITYSFENKSLVEIICFLSYIEDTINFFQLIWGYDGDGNEISLMKFNIGSVVSQTTDKSKDYLIVDYNYIKQRKRFEIEYIVSEIFIDESSPIIRYGKSFSISGDKLCQSRNNTINNIIN
jgi:hypothetical protein